MAKVSAGILLYRHNDGRLEVLLAHPGGPFWSAKDVGAWSLPKGEPEPGEEPLAAARREFEEEIGQPLIDGAVLPLGDVKLRSGKVVSGWAVEGDLDPGTQRSIETEVEWPPRSGRRMAIPEVDRVEWFDPDEARRRLNPAQAEFVDRLVSMLEAAPPSR